MTKRQLVVLSCDALAVTALSAYGSSWNETQQLEHLATRAVVWDRVITSTDETQEQLRRIWEPLLQANGARFLRSELILAKGEQASRLVSVAEQVGFDQCTLVDTEAPEVDELVSQPPRFSDDDSADNDSAGTETDDEDELEATAIAKLLSAAIERVSEGSSTEPAGESQDNRLVWIHSDLLMRVWDAPHWLFPVDDEEQGEAIEAPEDRTEWSLDDFSSDWLSPADPAPSSDLPGATGGNQDLPPPPLFHVREVPHLPLPKQRHPDLVLSWMQTYGCQVRLLDRMVRLLWEAISSSERETTFVLIGTSGFQLGQNGWIGHRAGPLRSPEIQVPAIVCQRTAGRTRMGLRISGVHSLEQVFDTVRAPYEAVNQGVREASSQDNSESYRAITPEFWAQCDSSDQPPVETQSTRATRALTTSQWFYVEEAEGVRLFSKPDDQGDVNDVAARCREVIEQLGSVSPC